jgi:hypothetical protein
MQIRKMTASILLEQLAIKCPHRHTKAAYVKEEEKQSEKESKSHDAFCIQQLPQAS